MANLKEIRSRISSVSSTMQITQAMKMVSAAKLKKAQDAIELVTDGMNIEDVLKELIDIFRSKIPEEVWPTPNP